MNEFLKDTLFEKEANILEEDLENGVIDQDQYRRAMLNLESEYASDFELK